MMVSYEKKQVSNLGSKAYIVQMRTFWLCNGHPAIDIDQPTATMSNSIDTFQALRFRDAFIASDI
jgi:hypothetical protein